METSVPFVPTEPAGCPRNPLSSPLSAENSPQGWIDGCCLKSVNQSQPVSARMNRPAAVTRRADILTCTAHLHCAAAAQNGFGFFQFFGRALHPHAEIAVTEAAVVADRHRQARDPRIDEETRDCGQPADQDHQLER